MAKLYGKNEAVDFAAANLVSFGGSFSRLNGQPIDKSQIWWPSEDKTGLERAKEYAASNAAYVGQEIAVIDVADSGNTSVVFYGIQDAAGTLKELGSKPLGDGASISVGEDGKITVYDFATAVEGTVAQKKDGKIKWVPISAIVQGDGNSITTLEAADASIEVTNSVDGEFEGYKYSAKVKLSAESDNSIELKEDGLYVHAADFTVVKDDSTEEGMAATYHLTKDGSNIGAAINIPSQKDYSVSVSTASPEDAYLKHYVFSQNGAEIAHIDIPKDLVVQSGTVEVKDESGAWGEAGTYLVLTIANQEAPIYINATDLVDVYTVKSTDSVAMAISGTEISANVKVSAQEGNSLAIKTDGLYVNAPTLPTVADSAVDKQVVVAVSQENGAIEVTRKQLSYNDLADAPVLDITEASAQAAVTGDTTAVVVGLDATGHSITPKTVEVATAAGLTRVEKLVSDPESGVVKEVTEVKNTVTEIQTDIANNYVTKAVAEGSGSGNQKGVRFISQEEIDILGNLNLGDDGKVEISGQVNANNVIGLYDKAVKIITSSTDEDLDSEKEGTQKGLGIEIGAQVNVIEGISLPDAALTPDEDKNVAIPLATYAAESHKTGLVRGSNDVNKVKFVDGVGEVNSLSIDKLIQGESTLILNGGDVSLA